MEVRGAPTGGEPIALLYAEQITARDVYFHNSFSSSANRKASAGWASLELAHCIDPPCTRDQHLADAKAVFSVVVRKNNSDGYRAQLALDSLPAFTGRIFGTWPDLDTTNGMYRRATSMANEIFNRNQKGEDYGSLFETLFHAVWLGIVQRSGDFGDYPWPASAREESNSARSVSRRDAPYGNGQNGNHDAYFRRSIKHPTQLKGGSLGGVYIYHDNIQTISVPRLFLNAAVEVYDKARFSTEEQPSWKGLPDFIKRDLLEFTVDVLNRDSHEQRLGATATEYLNLLFYHAKTTRDTFWEENLAQKAAADTPGAVAS